ncbi:MAG: hypothetical protein QXI93_01240 [Candidatus Methanomethylicia archaeon]
MSDEGYTLEIITANQERFEIKLITAIAPMTIFELMKKIPLKSTLIVHGNRILIPVPISMRMEKPSTNILKGDITYSTLNKSLIIHLEEEKIKTPETKIGKIASLEELRRIKSGTNIIIRRKD